MKQLIYLSCSPDHTYFCWQLEVQFLNFIDIGIPLSSYHAVVGVYNNKISDELTSLAHRYPTVNWGFVPDIRVNRSYIPTLKPHLAGYYLRAKPALNSHHIFYIDSDVLFKKPLDISRYLDDDVCYLSNTNSYINADYIKTKGSNLLDKMCEIVGVTVQQVEQINQHSGGGQYLLKNLPLQYWQKTEDDSLKLYNYMRDSIPHFAKEWSLKTGQPVANYNSIQIWCAEMWATLWNLLYFGKKVKVIPELDFCFATSTIDEYNKCDILHNAGVMDTNKNEMFYKGQFINGLPVDLDLSYVSDKYASFHYAGYVKKLLQIRRKSLSSQ